MHHDRYLTYVPLRVVLITQIRGFRWGKEPRCSSQVAGAERPRISYVLHALRSYNCVVDDRKYLILLLELAVY